MKLNLTFSLLSSLIGLTSFAQVALPYYSGYDTAGEKAGWAEYKKAATTFSHWGYAGANAFSAPNCISHDYSPSTGITLTDNWFVSPGFSLNNGGTLDSIRYMFSGFSVPQEGDTIALYVLHGSQDPALAESKTLLFDFRDSEYVTGFAYHMKENIALPAFDGLSYLAVRYRNTDCSSKWLTVNFDNVAISGGTVGVHEVENEADQISIYPNPASDMVRVDTKSQIESLDIFDITGARIKSLRTAEIGNTIDVSSFSKGIYLMRFNTGGAGLIKRIVIK